MPSSTQSDSQPGSPPDSSRGVRADGDQRDGTLLTLDRGIRVLEEVAQLEGSATARILSANLGINIGTCYQILRTLVVNGYVARQPGSTYGLGPRLAYLLDHFHTVNAPPAELLTVLRDLHARLGESVYVSMRSGNRLQIASYLEGTKAVRVSPLNVGYTDHLHARASGKAFLAYTAPEDLELYLDKDHLEPVTDHTIIDWGELLTDLDATRARGYALDLEEFNDGVACLSAPLIGPDGAALGAFAVSMPASALEQRRHEVATVVIDAGRRGSKALGYHGVYPPTVE